MTITAVFDSLEDMIGFAGKLVGNGSQEAVRTFLNCGEVYRPGENSQEATQDEPMETEGHPSEAQEEPEPVKEPEKEGPAYTLVQVREKLAELQKAGKRAQVQELIAGFGVKKLTEVPEDRYTELMQKAGEL
jgi:hypothetical protein